MVGMSLFDATLLSSIYSSSITQCQHSYTVVLQHAIHEWIQLLLVVITDIKMQPSLQ